MFRECWLVASWFLEILCSFDDRLFDDLHGGTTSRESSGELCEQFSSKWSETRPHQYAKLVAFFSSLRSRRRDINSTSILNESPKSSARFLISRTVLEFRLFPRKFTIKNKKKISNSNGLIFVWLDCIFTVAAVETIRIIRSLKTLFPKLSDREWNFAVERFPSEED